MVNKITAYQCPICNRVSSDKSKIEECEKSHVLEEDLEFCASKFDKERDIWENDRQKIFPTHILVSIKSYSGISAEYMLRKVGSDEEFINYYPVDD